MTPSRDQLDLARRTADEARILAWLLNELEAEHLSCGRSENGLDGKMWAITTSPEAANAMVWLITNLKERTTTLYEQLAMTT